MTIALTLRPITDTSVWVFESPLTQAFGSTETYTLDASEYGTPSAPDWSAVNLSTGADVSTAILSDTLTVSGNVITFGTVANLIAGCLYELKLTFTVGGTERIRYCRVRCSQ